MILTFLYDFNVLASFTVFIFALCFSIWLTFVMHLWSTFCLVVWKIYRYFNVLRSLFLCHRYRRCAEMSPRRIARVELAAPSCPIPLPPGLWLTSPAGWLPRTGISCGIAAYRSTFFKPNNVCEKIHQFLSSIKKDGHKTGLVPFFCLTVYMFRQPALIEYSFW